MAKRMIAPAHMGSAMIRKIAPVLSAFILASALQAAAQDMGSPMMNRPTVGIPDQGMGNSPWSRSTPTTTYDPATRERVTYSIDRLTGGYIEGVNTETRKSWHADIRPDGSMRGKDSDGDSWKYDRRAKLYTNLTTGKTCGKANLRHVCAP